MTVEAHTQETHEAEITLGPVLFNWAPEVWRDFYFRIADEAPVGTVYVGEVICSKRAPFFAPHFDDVALRLTAAGKTVVVSTLSQVMLPAERRMVGSVCRTGDALLEANDVSALWHLSGRPHHVGPFMNVYNEGALAYVAGKGAQNVCLAPELRGAAIETLGHAAADIGITLEVQVFGRMPLALSARCYHARAHERTRDSCRFVCEEDPDGLDLKTLDGGPFLTVNGIQTLSHGYLNLVGALQRLRAMGVSRFRLSPHSCDMVAVASIFRRALDKEITTEEAEAMLAELDLLAPFANGFFHGEAGRTWVAADAS